MYMNTNKDMDTEESKRIEVNVDFYRFKNRNGYSTNKTLLRFDSLDGGIIESYKYGTPSPLLLSLRLFFSDVFL
jgi:hypothetical protein